MGILKPVRKVFCTLAQLGNMQYEPFDAEQVAKNRLFTQYHAQYPKHQQERIMDELVNNKCKHRVFFVTVAFGIGIDCPNIRRVVHLGVPYYHGRVFPVLLQKYLPGGRVAHVF